jgi:MFS family permease
VAAALGPARIAILVPIAALLGAGEGLFLPGSFAIVPVLVPDQDLQAGNAVVSGGTQLATLAGPALGGALVAFLGPAPAFAIDAASFVISALSLLGIRTARRHSPAAAAAAALADNAGARSSARSRPGSCARPGGPPSSDRPPSWLTPSSQGSASAAGGRSARRRRPRRRRPPAAGRKEGGLA